MKLFRFVSTMLLILFTCSLANAVVMSQKQARITLALRLGGMPGATGQLVLDGLQNIYYYDTAVELLAATPTEGVVGWAIDTNVVYFYTGSAWVALAGASGFTGTNGGTFGNETNNVWTLFENDEDITVTFSTDRATIASSTGTLITITPAVTLSGAATLSSTLAVAGATTMASTLTVPRVVMSATEVDFTVEQAVPFWDVAAFTLMTEADTEDDFFRVGPENHYFEIWQDGNDTDSATSWPATAYGWTIPGSNAADQGMQITEGIVLGSAHSFTAGTTAAFKVRAAFVVATRAQHTELAVGFRVLAAYEVADDATEILAAYDDKVIIGIQGNAGVIKQQTSKATSDVLTSCTHAAAVDGDILALEVRVSAAGLTSVYVGTATPAGATTAQTQAAVTAAYADLTLDTLCQVTAITLTAGEYVPTIFEAKTNGGASTLAIAHYYAGPQ